jgi:hypothetical protein
MRCEDCRCRQDFIEVLELLSCSLLIRIGNCLVIDVGDVGEPIDDECAHHASLGHFILFDVDGGQIR